MDLQTVVDFKPLIEALLSLVGVALLSVATWAARWLMVKFKLEADDRVRSALLNGVHSAIDFAMNRARLAVGDKVTVDLHNKLLADAGRYVMERFPDAREHFGLSDKAVLQIIEARLPPIGTEAIPTPYGATLTSP